VIFEYEKKVRFGEIDEAGIVYFPRFFNFFHLAMEEFFEQAASVPYSEVIKKWKVGFPTVRVECDFFRPVQYGDNLRIAMTFPKLGRSSVRMRYRVRRSRDQIQIADALLTTACVDMNNFRARAMPDNLREVFERYREDESPGGGSPGELIVR
jgi:4-hydroxybenzoyl-CoA thioesterase